MRATQFGMIAALFTVAATACVPLSQPSVAQSGDDDHSPILGRWIMEGQSPDADRRDELIFQPSGKVTWLELRTGGVSEGGDWSYEYDPKERTVKINAAFPGVLRGEPLPDPKDWMQLVFDGMLVSDDRLILKMRENAGDSVFHVQTYCKYQGN